MGSGRATVVVVTWNAAHLLRECLDALRAQDVPHARFDVLIVDNDSHDDTDSVLREYPEVSTLRLPRNTGCPVCAAAHA